MNSIQFPNMFNHTVTNIVSDYEATLQNLKSLIMSDKTSLFGDPFYGSDIKEFLYEQNDTILIDIVIDSIYTSIATFMPQILVKRKDITITSDHKGSITISIKAINRSNYQTNLYNIVLFNTVV